jgi:hypothetical protein
MVSNPAALRSPPAFAGAGFDGFDLCTQTGSPESEKPTVFGRSDDALIASLICARSRVPGLPAVNPTYRTSPSRGSFRDVSGRDARSLRPGRGVGLKDNPNHAALRSS